MKTNKAEELVSGKAKSIYRSDKHDEFIMRFRDDTSAFDGAQIAQLSNKGKVNNAINSFIMTYLQEKGIETHFIEQVSEQESRVRNLAMIPVEFVVRNRAAGSLCKRLGIERGLELSPPLFELFYKDDALGDPMITEAHAVTFGWAKVEDLRRGQELSIEINKHLSLLFAKAGMILVDYKLEFGKTQEGKILLGDEFTPDGCRLWDSKSMDSLDKDRFRESKGGVVESYMVVAERLGVKIP